MSKLIFDSERSLTSVFEANINIICVMQPFSLYLHQVNIAKMLINYLLQ